eukprot:Skav223372  [mRNA]  locus=scaffold1536:202538:204418:+ [translate_table: standard]
MEELDCEVVGDAKDKGRRGDEPIGKDRFGWYHVGLGEDWNNMVPCKGDVMMITLPPGFVKDDEAVGALVVQKFFYLSDGSISVSVKSLGGKPASAATLLSNMFNRRNGTIHLCREEGRCNADPEASLHIQELELADGRVFHAEFVNARGRQLLNQIVSEAEAEVAKKVAEEDAKKKPSGGERRGALRKGPGTGKGLGGPRSKEKDGPGGADALRARLNKLKENELNKAGRGQAEAEGEDCPRPGKKPGTGRSAAQPTLKDGRALGISKEIREMAQRGQAREERKVAGQNAGTTSDLRMVKDVSSVGGQLIAAAAARQGRKRSDRNQDNRKEGGSRSPSPTERGRRRRRGRSRHRRRRGRDPSDGGSSGEEDDDSSASSSRSRRRRRRGKRARSSSEEDYLPPLRRKSERRPGSVLSLLIEQIETQLSELQGAEEHTGALVGGTKVVSYYHLLLRGSGVNPTSRDGRELFLLANLIDLLRGGSLDLVGDGMAARFLAIQQAVMDGQWTAARYLEIHNPEVMTAAGAALTLAARKHARIIDKAKGVEAPPKQDGKWNSGKGKGGSSWYYGDSYEERGRSKGKKGKGGRGNSWNAQKESWKYKNYSEWNPKQEANKDKGKDTGKKEGAA